MSLSALSGHALLVILLVGLPMAAAAQQPGPNVVFILADDLGWADVNSFDPLDREFYETPNIDRLADQGMTFSQAYTSAANCSPTRAALMSGQYYPRQPIYHVGSPGSGKMIPAENARHLPLEKQTLAETLASGGYETALIGKWHIGTPDTTGPRAQGFDVNIGGYMAGNPGDWKGGFMAPNNNPYIDDARPDEYLTDYLTRKAVSFIEERDRRPFYLQLSYYTPHWPLQAPGDRIEKYEQKAGTGGHDNATYAAMIESLDRGVGRIMETLERLEIADETIVIFYSDNGGSGSFRDLGRENNGITDNSPLKAGKGSFYEGGIRVPLIVRWPQTVEANTHTDVAVTSIDFYPTLLEAADIAPPADYVLDGESLMPVLQNPETPLDREAIYWHFPGYPNNPWRTTPVSVIRSGAWKLMKFYEDNRLELYNLAEDIGEEDNLAEEHPEHRKELHNQLQEWLEMHEAPMPQRR